MPQRKTLGNQDLVRIILWFCGEKKEAQDIREFKSVTKLQKLIFLAQKESEAFFDLQKTLIFIDQPFTFSADNFGPFSVDLTKLLHKMKRDEEIDIDKNGTSTCFTTKPLLKEKLSEITELLNKNSNVKKLISILFSANKLSLDQLLRYVYQKSEYDDYLVNSTIRNKHS